MLRYAAFLVIAGISAGPTLAQDIAPVISPRQVAEGLYYRSRMGKQAAPDDAPSRVDATRSSPTPETRALQARACANRSKFRAQYGPDHPKLKRLEALCKASGY